MDFFESQMIARARHPEVCICCGQLFPEMKCRPDRVYMDDAHRMRVWRRGYRAARFQAIRLRIIRAFEAVEKEKAKKGASEETT